MKGYGTPERIIGPCVVSDRQGRTPMLAFGATAYGTQITNRYYPKQYLIVSISVLYDDGYAGLPP